MNKLSQALLITLFLIIGCIELASGKENRTGNEGIAEEQNNSVSRTDRMWNSVQAFDGNEWFSVILNNGSWCSYEYSGTAGGLWPRGSSKQVVYDAGLWIGATVNGEVRVSAVMYGSKFSPGPILGDGSPGDPWDPAHRLYKVNRWNGAGDADWDEWPAALGAPVNASNDPYIPVDQTLFTVYNDLSDDGRFPSQPLGAEVRQTILGGVTSSDNGLNRTFYVSYEIINKSNDTWTDAQFSIWSDPDIDFAGNDLVGFDETTGMAFCYSAADGDPSYAIPPAVGYQLLEDSFGNGLGAFVYYAIDGDFSDPEAVTEAYNLQQGLSPTGQAIIDPTTSQATTYMVSGDPVINTGWIDSQPADKRILMTINGGDVAADATVSFVIAVTIAQGSDNLNSITELRASAAEALVFWNNGFSGITLVDRPILGGESFLFGMHLSPVDPGQTSEGFLELSNNGNQTLAGTLEFPTGSGFSASPSSFSIEPDVTETITIHFTVPEATPTDRYVPDEYATIQAAVDAAQIALFLDTLDIPSNDSYAAQVDNMNPQTWMNYEGDWILVEPGNYVENVVVEGKTVHLEAIGDVESTIIDGNQTGSCLELNNAHGSSIHGFTIQNGDAETGGGLYVTGEGFKIADNIIKNNSANYGGGIYAAGNGGIIRNLIINNSAEYGGGARLRHGAIDFVNNTLWGNSASDGGSGLFIRSPGHRIVNTIIWGNIDSDAILVNYNPEDYWIEFCEIEGGWNFGEGNINADPLFVDSGNDDFHLQDGSPCINAGHPDLNGNGIPWYQDPEDQDPDQTRMDMGVFFRPSGNVVIFPYGFTKILHVDEAYASVAFEIQNWGDDPFDYWLQIESADSTYIVYLEEPDPYSSFNGNIWWMRPDGSEKTQLTYDVQDNEPVWSPDGSQIVFASERSGNADVWVIDADGTNLVNLTNHEAYDAQPDWSPDGSQIIFTSYRDDSYEIYRMSNTGANVVRLTDNDVNDNRPRYSPDGEYFVTRSRVSGGDWDVYIYTSDGQSFTNIGIPGVRDYFPSFSPTGKRIVWSSFINGNDADIVSANVDGSGFRLEFVRPGFNDWYPRYSPDGQFIAFAGQTYTDFGDEIYILNRITRRLRQITDNTYEVGEWGPNWSLFLNPPQWLWLDHDAGQIGPGGSNAVHVNIDVGGLPIGEHSASVMIRNAANDELVWVFPVNIRLTETHGAEIVDIADVRDDQGGYVHVRFLKSMFDTDHVSRSTEFYTLWRRLPSGQWEGLRSIGALNAFEYVILGETLQDATIFDYHETEFRITAHMDEGTFVSESFWGASWDNIPPGIPGNIGVDVGNDWVELAWDQSSDEDFMLFRIYRGDTPDFDPGEVDPIATTADNFFTDSPLADGPFYYLVTAVDAHWNESDFSAVVEAILLGTDEASLLPQAFALHQNHPNPFNPVTTIRYDLPEQSYVIITIHDLLGRHVKTLVNRTEDPGYKAIIWDATDSFGEPVGAGVYIYKLNTGDFSQTEKMVLIK